MPQHRRSRSWVTARHDLGLVRSLRPRARRPPGGCSDQHRRDQRTAPETFSQHGLLVASGQPIVEGGNVWNTDSSVMRNEPDRAHLVGRIRRKVIALPDHEYMVIRPPRREVRLEFRHQVSGNHGRFAKQPEDGIIFPFPDGVVGGAVGIAKQFPAVISLRITS